MAAGLVDVATAAWGWVRCKKDASFGKIRFFGSAEFPSEGGGTLPISINAGERLDGLCSSILI